MLKTIPDIREHGPPELLDSPLRAIPHERKLQALAMAGGLPAILVAGALLLRSPWPLALKIGILLVLSGAWLAAGAALHKRALAPLQILANLLAALREGDFSFRAKPQAPDSALGTVFAELNTLADLLQHQRLGALEATALLRTVMAEIEVAIFAFDEEDRLRLVNRSGEDLLLRPREQTTGLKASDLGLDTTLAGPSPRLLDLAFPGRAGRWELRRGTFRQGGRPHHLVVLSDLTRPLREEEQLAWQRLIRVLSHEFNNSLAPIHSLAASLLTLLSRDPEPGDLREDLRQGLEIMGSRAESLRRFLDAYARLARLPAPTFAPLDLPALIQRVAALETRLPVRVDPGPPLTLAADRDQLEQLLINLVRNAVEAMRDTGGTVGVAWLTTGPFVEIRVEDEGPGLPTRGNLFVPFFTTKPGGSGIGLVLARQIAEQHHGTLSLENREGARGARAQVRLPC